MASNPNVEPDHVLRQQVDRYRALGRRDLVRFKVFIDHSPDGTSKVVKQPLDHWQSGHVDDLVIDEHVARGQPIGVRLPPGVFVIDIDPRNGGKEAFEDLLGRVPGLVAWAAKTERVATGGGGRHMYGTLPPGVRVGGKIPGYPGIDIKGPGTLVIIPGSTYPGGTRYELTRDAPALPVPPALLDMIARPDRPPGDNSPHEGQLDLEEVADLLDEIDNPDVDYDDWFKVLAAVHYEVGETGRELALAWSMSSDKHEQGRFDTAWNSLGKYSGKAATGGTLYHLARYGWPRSGVEEFGEEGDSGWEQPPPVEDYREGESRENDAVSPGVEGLVVPISAARAKSVRWLIKGWLPLDSLLLLIGAPGSFKSFLSIMWAVYVAAGRDWAGARVREARTVVYLAGEGQHGLRRRFEAAARVLGVDLDSLPVLILGPGQHVDLMMGKGSKGVTEAVERVVEERGWPTVGLVVVDTFARMSTGDENSAEDVARFFSNVGRWQSRWGAAVLTVHHPGHGDGTRARGSSAWRGAMDGEFLLQRVPGAEEAVLTPAKVKDGREPEAIGLRAREVFFGVDEDGDEVTTLALEVDNQVVQEVRESEREDDLALMKAVRDGGGKRSLAALAESLGWERSTVTGRAKALRKRGLLTPEGPLDLTAKGLEACEYLLAERE